MTNSNVFSVVPMDQFRRFLTVGVANGCVVASEEQLTEANTAVVAQLIAANGKAVVDEIVKFSEAGRAPKKDPQLYALALCATSDDKQTRRLAYEALPKVCTIPTHLFGFIGYCEAISDTTGWGRARRTAVANWYNEKSIGDLIYHVTKYKQRDGWSHRDLLRLAHVKPVDNEHNLVYKFVAKGELAFAESEVSDKKAFDRLVACDEIQRTDDPDKAIQLIRDHNLVWEHIPTELHRHPAVWLALLDRIPMTALIRNLGRMTNIGLLEPNSDATVQVLNKLSNVEAIKRSKIHPISALTALETYRRGGEGGLGKLRWTPNRQIVDALNDLFYASFGAIDSANKRFYVGVDVSGSMTNQATGSILSCCTIAAALGMQLVRTEKIVTIKGFARTLKDLNISKSDSLEVAVKKCQDQNFGSTNTAAIIQDALNRNIPVDCFVVITDCEHNSGEQPMIALQRYREKTGIDAKLVSLSLTSSSRTIADPNDIGSLDLSGFDSAFPSIIKEFVSGGF
jgi:60 kDa SS-A/Ro ribonucleoprotein